MKEIEIHARGMTFQALADGPEDGPLLLLLHGLPRNRWEWHQIPPMAEMGFRAVAPDLRGVRVLRPAARDGDDLSRGCPARDSAPETPLENGGVVVGPPGLEPEGRVERSNNFS